MAKHREQSGYLSKKVCWHEPNFAGLRIGSAYQRVGVQSPCSLPACTRSKATVRRGTQVTCQGDAGQEQGDAGQEHVGCRSRAKGTQVKSKGKGTQVKVTQVKGTQVKGTQVKRKEPRGRKTRANGTQPLLT